jgi:hypothetical protein
MLGRLEAHVGADRQRARGIDDSSDHSRTDGNLIRLFLVFTHDRISGFSIVHLVLPHRGNRGPSDETLLRKVSEPGAPFRTISVEVSRTMNPTLSRDNVSNWGSVSWGPTTKWCTWNVKCIIWYLLSRK